MAEQLQALKALYGELEQLLESQVTELTATMKAVQEVNARIAATSAELERNRTLKADLSEQLGALQGTEAGLKADNQKLSARATELQNHIDGLRKKRKQLVGQVKGLTAQAKG